jgi:hypothetical protein
VNLKPVQFRADDLGTPQQGPLGTSGRRSLGWGFAALRALAALGLMGAVGALGVPSVFPEGRHLEGRPGATKAALVRAALRGSPAGVAIPGVGSDREPARHVAAPASAQLTDWRNPPLLTPALICTSTNESAWTSVSGLCHMLMYYGLGKTDLPGFPTGRSLLRPLIDEQTAIKVFGESPFIRTRNGIRYTLFNGPLFHSKVGEAHRDQCLATFAELHLPLNTPVRLKAGAYCIGDLLSEAVANFDLDEREPAWTAMALTRYLPPRKEWVDRFGEGTTFSKLVQHLLHVDPNRQSCGGTHLLEALGLIAKADQRCAILDEDTRQKLQSYLTRTFHEIVQRQQPDGGWNKRWCAAINNDDTGRMSPLEMRVLVTGHLVAILREIDVSRIIPRKTYERAAEWLERSLRSNNIHSGPSWICPVTHASVSIYEVEQPREGKRIHIAISTPHVAVWAADRRTR